MKLLTFEKTETGFDYASFGLAEIKEEADFAAISACRTLEKLKSALKTLILEDAPRICKIRDAMEGKKHPKTGRSCWKAWLEQIFPLSKSTLYNALLIHRELEKELPNLGEETIDSLLQWSGRALIAALSATGDNREIAIAELSKLPTKEVTEPLVRNKYKPIATEEEQQLLGQIDQFCEEELGLEDPKILKLRAKHRATEIAKNQNKRLPSISDLERAIGEVTGKEPKPLSGNRTHTTAKAYEELRQQYQALNQTNEELRCALQEAYDRIHQLEQQLGIAA